jgi:hypothetical protein
MAAGSLKIATPKVGNGPGATRRQSAASAEAKMQQKPPNRGPFLLGSAGAAQPSSNVGWRSASNTAKKLRSYRVAEE